LFAQPGEAGVQPCHRAPKDPKAMVRQAMAVALHSDGSWSSLVLENGAWKGAD